MKVIVVGMGVQGHKRKAVAGDDCIATVDPVNPNAEYKDLRQVDINSYDAALLCTPDGVKNELIQYLLENGKHVMVEKPLFAARVSTLRELKLLAEAKKVALYTAYNHRFEPHFVRMKELVASKRLGPLYFLKMSYGNGTAREVRNSVWRDKGFGVLPDIGSHLLDFMDFLFPDGGLEFQKISFNNFENMAYDHVLLSGQSINSSVPKIFMEAMLLSWRNSFTFDLYGEKGSAHINCLCKWGPSHFIVRDRVLPSGKPREEIITLDCPDPTWKIEYDYFNQICKEQKNFIDRDIWIQKSLETLGGGPL